MGHVDLVPAMPLCPGRKGQGHRGTSTHIVSRAYTRKIRLSTRGW